MLKPIWRDEVLF